MLSQFSTNAHSILNLCSCKYDPIFTYNDQWNVNIVDWYQGLSWAEISRDSLIFSLKISLKFLNNYFLPLKSHQKIWNFIISMKFSHSTSEPGRSLWYVDWIRNCIKLIVYYHNHENTSHFDCLSTHLYIQDWNPGARSSAKPTNSLAGPSDSIQWHGSGSTLARLMAWCLMAPSHHLYQYWLLITTVQWDSSEGSFTRDAPAINHWN